METRTFSIKIKENVGMSRTKKHMNKVGMILTQEIDVGPKIKQTTSIQAYISTIPTLFTCFLGFDIPTFLSFLLKIFFIILFSY